MKYDKFEPHVSACFLSDVAGTPGTDNQLECKYNIENVVDYKILI